MSPTGAAKFARLRLPESTHALRMHSEHGVDRYVALRFVISKHDLAAFRKKSNLPELRKGYVAIVSAHAKQRGWQLDDLDKFAGASEVENRLARNVVVDLSQEASVTVYVEAFEM